MKSRVRYCDALRTLAIWCVILIHVFPKFRNQYLNLSHTCYFVLTFLDSLTRVGVPIFFMITGAFMLNRKNKDSYKEFLVKRVLKLFVPFFIFSLFYYFYNYFIGETTEISVVNFISMFTSNQIKYHFWFMYDILVIYLFIPYFRVLVQNLKRLDLRNIIFLIFLFGNIFGTINLFCERYKIDLFTSFVLPDVIKYTNYLFLGYYLYNYNIKEKNKKIIYVLGIISICLIPFADSLFITNFRNDAMLNAHSMFVFIPSMAVFIFFKDNYNKLKVPNIVNSFFYNSASYIFYVYMVHVYVLKNIEDIIFKYYYPNRFIMVVVMIYVIFVLTTVVSYILAFIIYKIFNKVGYIVSKKKLV